MKRLVLMTLIAGVLAAGTAGSHTYLDRPYGTPQLGASARAAALGGAATALATGAYSLVDNPAQLAGAGGSRLDLTGRLTRVSENRFVPLYDTFDAFVEEAAVAVNDNVYGNVSGGLVYDRGRLVLAAGVFDRYDPRYDYYDERRTTATSDVIIAERWIETRGVIRSAAIGAALPIGRGSFGVALHRYDGTVTHRSLTVPRTGGAAPADTVVEYQLDGITAVVGGGYQVHERLDLGLTFETGPKLDAEADVWEDGVPRDPVAGREDPIYPWRLQGGVRYRPRNAARATFVADVILLAWSETNLRLPDGEKLRDAWDVRFGIEHVYYNSLPGRVGFRYAHAPTARDADQATFTLGLGFRADRTMIDLSGEVGRRTSRQEPLWPRDPAYASIGAGRDRVEDTVVQVRIGIQQGW